MKQIDINCDLGEGIGNEALLMPYLSSCNIACGGHAGEEFTMNLVSELAARYNVKIGAHPSFPDRKNFGRKNMNMSPVKLKASLTKQINALKQILDRKNLKMHHVKPHGALYNLAARDPNIANSIVEVIKSFDANWVLFAPFGSVISEMAVQKGVKVMFEAFADRNYNEDLTLVSRSKSNAIIQDSETMFRHVHKIIFDGKVTTINGVEVELKADTICLHGDGVNVVNNLKELVAKLKQNNIEIS